MFWGNGREKYWFFTVLPSAKDTIKQEFLGVLSLVIAALERGCKCARATLDHIQRSQGGRCELCSQIVKRKQR
jgi:hypothetical protein